MGSVLRLMLVVAALPSSASEAGATREEGAAPGAAPRCPEGMVYVPLVPGGTYIEGTKAPDEPAFCIDKYETTVEEYSLCRVVGRCPIEAKTCHRWKHGQASLPIECANLAQAVAYCQYRGKRLPTYSEWERAATGNHKDRRYNPWDPDTKLVPGGVCWDRTKKQGPCPVGTSPQDVSPVGAYDMGANVQEWTYKPKDPAHPLNEQAEYMTQSIAGAWWTAKPGEFLTPGQMGSAFAGSIWSSPDAPLRRAGIRCAQAVESR